MPGENEKKVALITWGSAGGPFPRIMRWLAKGLASKGRKVDILFLQDPKGIKRVEEQIREIGLGTRARWATLPLRNYFKEAKPALAIATPAHVALATLLAGRLTATPVVPWEPAFLSLDRRFLPVSMRLVSPVIRRLLYRWSAAVASVSRDVATEVKNELALRNVFVLPNPCDPNEIYRRAGGAFESRIKSTCKLVAAGRMVYEKGIDILLSALCELESRGIKSWEMEVLGNGPKRLEYEKMANNMGLSNKVRFLGYVPNPYPTMAQADVFVHPVRWEGFGMVLVEAMALGLPVVATACPGGPKEILDNGRYGILVPPEDPAALADALATLIQDASERERLAKVAKERADYYRPERIAEYVLQIEEYVRNAKATG